MQQAAHKMKYFFIFLFLFTLPFVSSYYPGEQLDVSYNNITNVSYPCILINQSIYISSDISLGDQYCNITYINIINEPISNGGGGGGGGSSSRRRSYEWECTEWTACQTNNKATRNCTNQNDNADGRPFETRSCYLYVNTDKPSDVITDKPIEQIEVINISTDIKNETYNGTTTIETKKPNGLLFFSIVGTLVLIIAVIINMRKDERQII